MSKTGQGPTRYDLPYATTKDIIQSTHRAKPELVGLFDSLVIAEDVQDAFQILSFQAKTISTADKRMLETIE